MEADYDRDIYPYRFDEDWEEDEPKEEFDWVEEFEDEYGSD